MILDVQNLTKTFGGFTAVDTISFGIEEGEIVGLLGPNGAGKTTTIQMLLGLTMPTSGTIRYFGKPFEDNREEILARINTSSGYARLPWKLKVRENLNVFGHLYQVKNYQKKIEELADRFDATEQLDKIFQDLSAGQMTRILLIKAFINDPELVLLDEPTASLDPDIADAVRSFILEERKRRKLSLLITSHNMGEVEELCDRVIFLHRGKIYAIDTPENLAKRNTQSQVNLMIKDGLKRLMSVVKKGQYLYTERNRFVTVTMPEDTIAIFLLELGERGIQYDDIEIVRPSLEDFFLSVTKEFV